MDLVTFHKFFQYKNVCYREKKFINWASYIPNSGFSFGHYTGLSLWEPDSLLYHGHLQRSIDFVALSIGYCFYSHRLQSNTISEKVTYSFNGYILTKVNILKRISKDSPALFFLWEILYQVRIPRKKPWNKDLTYMDLLYFGAWGTSVLAGHANIHRVLRFNKNKTNCKY